MNRQQFQGLIDRQERFSIRFDSYVHAVEIEDLLGRDTIDVAAFLQSSLPYYVGKKVLVTGGGGSIGRELCRQLMALDPATRCGSMPPRVVLEKPGLFPAGLIKLFVPANPLFQLAQYDNKIQRSRYSLIVRH